MNKKNMAALLVTACVALAHASEEAVPTIAGLKPIEFIGFNVNPAVFLSQVVTFLIALAVVWGFAWKPLLKMITDRRDLIRKSVEDAEQARLAVARIEEDNKARLEEIRKKSDLLLAEAKIDAAKVREKLVSIAQQESDEIRAKANEQLENDRTRLVEEVRADVVKLAVAIAAKAVGEAVDAKIQQSRFENILAEVETQAKKGLAS